MGTGMQRLADSMPQWIQALCRSEGLPDAYAEAVTDYVAPVAAAIAGRRAELGRPVIAGINGAQGAGKTTFARFAAEWLRRELGLAVASLSLDDLYLGNATRARLAREVHPLFATRGVPGTHDVELGEHVLAALTASAGGEEVAVPAFDKASDDRVPRDDWCRVSAPVDVVLFEGWCVGARPQRSQDLLDPVNSLEAVEDPDGRWRRYVNTRLQSDYAGLFGRLDMLVMLKVPSFDKVFDWRRLQEQRLRERLAAHAGSAAAGQTDVQLDRFIRHFERLTRHMLLTMPGYADMVIDIDDQHRLTRVRGA